MKLRWAQLENELIDLEARFLEIENIKTVNDFCLA